MVCPDQSVILYITDQTMTLIPPRTTGLSEPFFASLDDDGVALRAFLAKCVNRDAVIIDNSSAHRHELSVVPNLSFIDRKRVMASRLRRFAMTGDLNGIMSLSKSENLLISLERTARYLQNDALANFLKGHYWVSSSFTIEVLPILTALTGTDRPTCWVVGYLYIGNGQFRLIAAHGKKIILSRVTPPLVFNAEQSQFTDLLFDDFSTVVRYLSRYGLKDVDDIKCLVIVPDTIETDHIDFAKTSQNIAVYSASQAAKALGLSAFVSLQDERCDWLYASYIARQKRLQCPIIHNTIRKHLINRRLTLIGWFVVFIVSLSLTALALGELPAVYAMHSATRRKEINLHQLKNQLNTLPNDEAGNHEKLSRLRLAVERNRLFAVVAPPFLDNLSAIASKLGELSVVSHMTWQKGTLSLDLVCNDLTVPSSFRSLAQQLGDALYPVKVSLDVPVDELSHQLSAANQSSVAKRCGVLSFDYNAKVEQEVRDE